MRNSIYDKLCTTLGVNNVCQSAEQRERLIILIGKELDYTVNYHNEASISGIEKHSFYVESSYVKDNFNVSEDTYSDAIYELVYLFYRNNILKDDEVMRALKGKIND